MPLSTQSHVRDEHYVLAASLDNVRNLSNILKILQITMSPSQPYFRLSTFGNSGSAHYDYPKDSDMMELFQCTKTQTNRYKMSLLKPSTKALSLSCKVSVRTDNQGFLSLQYLVRNDDGQICFVEYYCCPDEEVED
uniref:RAD1 homolog (S. pombe) n=1 Tax=Scleropages formosus TaxID=113540 RepID=A0A8C9WAY5_SCLFO